MEITTKEPTLENLVEDAKEGNKNALEELVRQIKDKVYSLALRMLYFPADAEDASQEILIKIITHLDGFEGRSRFSTWVYKIASNHLLTTRQRRAERYNFSFEHFEQMIDSKQYYPGPSSLTEGERRLLIKEMKLMCTQSLLLCLRRDLRLAYIIGDIFGASSQEGAEILDITPETFRQRLSRGRKQIHEFMAKKCSLIYPDNPCHCIGPVNRYVNTELLNPKKLIFMSHPCQTPEKETTEMPTGELDELARITAVFRSHPQYAAPEAFVDIVKELMDSGRFQLLSAH